MRHTYNIEGMTCSSCISKVQHAIEQLNGVSKVVVQLQSPQAFVEMDHHLPTKNIQEAISKAGNYTITEIEHHAKTNSDESEGFKLITYKPLLLIVTFILGISLIASLTTSAFQPELFMRYFMAGFFLVFSFFKFLDLKGFAESYSTYDLLASRVKAYGFIYPFLELGLGIAYLVDFNSAVTNLSTLLILGFSSIGVIQSVLDKKKIKCACLGTVFNLPMSTVTIIEDVGMVVMAGVMLMML